MKRATASSTGSREAGPAAALDGNPDSYWAASNQTTGSLEVDLGGPTTFGIAALQEAIAFGQRVAEYHIEVMDGIGWKTVSKGKLGAPPSLSRTRRLLIL